MAVQEALRLALLLAGLRELAVLVQAGGHCREHVLDFIVPAGDALSARIEDDVRADLAMIGITVRTRLLKKADFNRAMQEGDFHLCFTESWGPPYDPHSFATGWFKANNEAHYSAMDGLEPPMTKARLHEMVTDVLKAENTARRQEKWTQILQEMHDQAISNPMWSRRMPAVINRRLQGYVAGAQQWDYPMHEVEVLRGSTSVTVAPGAQTGLFITSGPLDPHSYGPNEFFISNWIYEGLVSYGQGGSTEPMLATAWTVSDTSDGGQEYRFTLRQNVTFHDGTDFNCAAVKMNFDHVLQPALLKYHGWYHLPRYARKWKCDGEVFVVTLSEVYYPFLQELSLIRPLRILSPESFKDGASSDPLTHNSCPPKWVLASSNVSCVGVRSSHGTGPWIFNGTTLRKDGSISEVKFARNPRHWGPHGNIAELVVRNYNSSEQVQAALLNKSLDMVVGGGVLTPEQVKGFQDNYTGSFHVVMGPPLMNTIIVMNSGRAPTHDLHVRKLITHAINKASIVRRELAGSATVAYSLFPEDAPYCNVDLTPRLDYDLEKAQLMNCPEQPLLQQHHRHTGTALGFSMALVACFLLVAGAACFFVGRRAGYKEMFDSMRSRRGCREASTIGLTSAC